MFSINVKQIFNDKSCCRVLKIFIVVTEKASAPSKSSQVQPANETSQPDLYA